MTDIKLPQAPYKYEKFSRNLNSSIASLYDNHVQTENMNNDIYDEIDISQGAFNNSALNNLSYVTNMLEKSFTQNESGLSRSNSNTKCKSLGCLLASDNQSVDSKQSNLNVKDLITKFESR